MERLYHAVATLYTDLSARQTIRVRSIESCPCRHSNMRQMHPGMSIEKTLHRFRDEQKAKLRRKGPKLY